MWKAYYLKLEHIICLYHPKVYVFGSADGRLKLCFLIDPLKKCTCRYMNRGAT